MFILKLLPLVIMFSFTLYCWHKLNVECDPVLGLKWMLMARVALFATVAYFVGLVIHGAMTT